MPPPAAPPPLRGTAGVADRLSPTRGSHTPAPPATPLAADVSVAGEDPSSATMGWGEAVRRYLPPTLAAEVAADDDGGRGDAAAPAAATPTRLVTPPPQERVASMTGRPLFDVRASLAAGVVGGWLLALAEGLRSLPALSWCGCWLFHWAVAL